MWVNRRLCAEPEPDGEDEWDGETEVSAPLEEPDEERIAAAEDRHDGSLSGLLPKGRHEKGDRRMRAAAREIRDFGAGNGTRTRDIKLGKLALYQLSYARSIV